MLITRLADLRAERDRSEADIEATGPPDALIEAVRRI